MRKHLKNWHVLDWKTCPSLVFLNGFDQNLPSVRGKLPAASVPTILQPPATAWQMRRESRSHYKWSRLRVTCSQSLEIKAHFHTFPHFHYLDLPWSSHSHPGIEGDKAKTKSLGALDRSDRSPNTKDLNFSTSAVAYEPEEAQLSAHVLHIYGTWMHEYVYDCVWCVLQSRQYMCILVPPTQTCYG